MRQVLSACLTYIVITMNFSNLSEFILILLISIHFILIVVKNKVCFLSLFLNLAEFTFFVLQWLLTVQI
jgi:hypothetical protein